MSENPDAYIIRSQNLHNQDFPSNFKAIARAGAGKKLGVIGLGAIGARIANVLDA